MQTEISVLPGQNPPPSATHGSPSKWATSARRSVAQLFWLAVAVSPACCWQVPAYASTQRVIHAGSLSVEAGADGSYLLRSSEIAAPVLHAQPAADLMGTPLRADMYPAHTATVRAFQDALGRGEALVLENTGLAGKPDLIAELRLYQNRPFGSMQTTLRNKTGSEVSVHALTLLQSVANAAVHLGGPDGQDRVLSDSFSEDAPAVRIKDLGDPADGLHRGFGSQLIYNRASGESLFLGALTARRWMTMFHLQATGKGDGAHIVRYDAEATGTQEGEPEQAAQYPAENNVALRLGVAPGESLSSEPVMFSIGKDYHAQLEEYGRAVGVVNHARVTTPTPIGWWSWTAFYYGVTEGNVLTNAEWLAQNLEPLGYRYFQVDEGYQYARGEYATPDAKTFPRGVDFVSNRVRGMGLVFGLWVAPFQVSDRSWVYQHHPDWLVHTPSGAPVHIGKVGGRFDDLYSLDTTNPGAQEYLRSTYRTLAKGWGVRFIKMDFMDSSAVEGVFYRPNTTALEAQRIGLETIREAVGEDVVLDKDGSPMLTPVGIVDAGRTSQDTGHTFESTRDAATGVVARWYMNRNFYITDPDAFTVSTQTVPDRGWHGNKSPLTLDEAESSIALSAISGGMFEIGDDLPTLGSSPERLALVRNTELIDMARLGRASTPVDLMTYAAADRQPSVFLLNEDARQQILTVFNWTDSERTHTVPLGSLGLGPANAWTATDVLRPAAVPIADGKITLQQPPHSVRMIRLVDTSAKQGAPEFRVAAATSAAAGQELRFSAAGATEQEPVLQYTWNFGDGIRAEGAQVNHTFTLAGTYHVLVSGTGLEGRTSQHTLDVTVKGFVPTVYDPQAKERPTQTQ